MNLNFTDENGYAVNVEISKPDDEAEPERRFKTGFGLPEKAAE